MLNRCLDVLMRSVGVEFDNVYHHRHDVFVKRVQSEVPILNDPQQVCGVLHITREVGDVVPGPVVTSFDSFSGSSNPRDDGASRRVNESFVHFV